MKTALYVFLAILAAYAVIYIFERVVAFVKKVNRNTPKITPYNGQGPSYSNYNYTSSVDWNMRDIRSTLDRIEEKVDQLVEDTGELLIAKEHREE